MASSTMRFLGWVERAGNRLPHPFWLFCWLLVLVAGASAALAALGVSVERPQAHLLNTLEKGVRVEGRDFSTDDAAVGPTLALRDAARSGRFGNLWVELFRDGVKVAERKVEAPRLAALSLDRRLFSELEPRTDYRAFVVNRAQTVALRSVLSKDGIRWFVTTLVDNFAHFAPLGLVLVMLMGVSIAEGAGLIATAMRGIALTVPRALLIPVVFALAACGNIGSDAGVVVMPPLAAALFRQMGRSPIAGLIVGYVGATAGFTANLLPAGTDVLAMSLTNAATGGTPPVNVLSNWYYMAASVLLLSVVATWVTVRFLLPRLEGSTAGSGTAESRDVAAPSAPESAAPLSAVEKRAAGYAGLAIVITAGLWLLTLLPEGAWLREEDPEPAMFWRSPFFRGLIPILFSLFAVGGVVYGKVAGTITRADDVVGFMADAMKRMGGYLVLVLAMAEFTALFQWVGLDILLSVEGAQLLRAVGMESQPIPFFIAFISLVAFANLFLGSASAKWAIFAPIFVPMFMGVGFHPAFTQLLYRVGDSITNCVTPLYPYFPILLEWVRAQDPKRAQVGTILSYLVPYAIFLFVGWVIMVVFWYLLGLPVGPDSPLRL